MKRHGYLIFNAGYSASVPEIIWGKGISGSEGEKTCWLLTLDAVSESQMAAK